MQPTTTTQLTLTAITILCFGFAGFAQGPRNGSGPDDRTERNRGDDRPSSEQRPEMRAGTFVFRSMTLPTPTDIRTIDASGNNLQHHEWGKADIELVRWSGAAYEDGAAEASGADRPNARLISNAVAAQNGPTTNRVGASDFLWQWGQFLDHDLDLTPEIEPAEFLDIAVPLGDPHFDPFFTGTNTIPMHRAFYRDVDGVREQVNDITAYIDGSNVYGSDDARAAELRSNDGTGRLKTSDGDLLPFNLNGFANAPSALMPTLFLAGDVRANEQTYLMSMHTLFVREHNTIADELRADNPDMDGDTIYELARLIVVAELQAITYNEFLPTLLGPRALPTYEGYNPEVRADIANVFSTAAFRFGHTMLPTQLLRLDADNNEIPAGHLTLARAFFVPDEVITHGIEPYLRGLAAQKAQEIDNMLVDDVRNFLFGPPGSGGLDLASLNIQRGRDHGLPGLNRLRADLGLQPYNSFAELNPDPAVHKRIASVYDHVDDIDPWVGILAEPKTGASLLGETGTVILREQFTVLRDGDRFFYRSDLPEELADYIETQTLATIIRSNTDIGDELQDNVFIVGPTETMPAITRMGMDARTGATDLRWNSVPGERYRVRSSKDLHNWIDVDPNCKSEGWTSQLRVASDTDVPRLRFFLVEPSP